MEWLIGGLTVIIAAVLFNNVMQRRRADKAEKRVKLLQERFDELKRMRGAY